MQKSERWEVFLGGGFKCALFSPIFREDVQFDQYFSDGLKTPTSSGSGINVVASVEP